MPAVLQAELSLAIHISGQRALLACQLECNGQCGNKQGLLMPEVLLDIGWCLMQAGAGPLESRIPANLRANFSRAYLAQKVDGGRTRGEVRRAVEPALTKYHKACQQYQSKWRHLITSDSK